MAKLSLDRLQDVLPHAKVLIYGGIEYFIVGIINNGIDDTPESIEVVGRDGDGEPYNTIITCETLVGQDIKLLATYDLMNPNVIKDLRLDLIQWDNLEDDIQRMKNSGEDNV